MAYLKITPGIGYLSNVGRVLSPAALQVTEDLKSKVIARDDNTCRYCGFKARKYQEVVYIGQKDEPEKEDHYATACIFCHQCYHLEKIDRMQSGAVIWLPEISQPLLHHVCRAIYVARISRGPMADAARDAMEALLSRKEAAVHRLGTDSPRILSTVLQDFLEVNEYKLRLNKLKGFRILPLDRRIIKEGELEFNQFPQVLAYWRSKEGPFGDLPPRKWVELFYQIKETAGSAA